MIRLYICHGHHGTLDGLLIPNELSWLQYTGIFGQRAYPLFFLQIRSTGLRNIVYKLKSSNLEQCDAIIHLSRTSWEFRWFIDFEIIELAAVHWNFWPKGLRSFFQIGSKGLRSIVYKLKSQI